MIGETYYKAKLIYAEEGMCINFIEYKVVYETNCYAYCVPDRRYPIPGPLKLEGESDYQCAKRLGIVKRIHKQSSRVAFTTKEAALKRLCYLKSLQVRHLQRELELLRFFNKKIAGLDLDDLEAVSDGKGHEFYRVVPETQDKVLEFYCFN